MKLLKGVFNQNRNGTFVREIHEMMKLNWKIAMERGISVTTTEYKVLRF
jgi:hypothetical protein